MLVEVWDPIGIKNEPRAQGEYDRYIGGVVSLLTNHGSEKQIEDYLWKVVEEWIHTHPQKGATQNAARVVRNIRLE